jgi:WXG100 family type VII secretion target
MATSGVRAELSAMSSVSSSFNGDYENLSTTISLLRNEVDALAAAWKAQSSTAFQGVFTEVDSAWTKLNQVLSSISTTIVGNATGYNTQDATGASTVQSVDVTGISSALNH